MRLLLRPHERLRCRRGQRVRVERTATRPPQRRAQLANPKRSDAVRRRGRAPSPRRSDDAAPEKLATTRSPRSLREATRPPPRVMAVLQQQDAYAARPAAPEKRHGSCGLWLKRNWVLVSLAALAFAGAVLSILLFLEPCPKKEKGDITYATERIPSPVDIYVTLDSSYSVNGQDWDDQLDAGRALLRSLKTELPNNTLRAGMGNWNSQRVANVDLTSLHSADDVDATFSDVERATVLCDDQTDGVDAAVRVGRDGCSGRRTVPRTAVDFRAGERLHRSARREHEHRRADRGRDVQELCVLEPRRAVRPVEELGLRVFHVRRPSGYLARRWSWRRISLQEDDASSPMLQTSWQTVFVS